jgi:hypothetical protein
MIWSAVAERSGDTALDWLSRLRTKPKSETLNNPKRRRRFALPAHSKSNRQHKFPKLRAVFH